MSKLDIDRKIISLQQNLHSVRSTIVVIHSLKDVRILSRVR